MNQDPTTEPWEMMPEEAPRSVRPHSEDVRRIEVDEEDRLAFRVGVNLITLVLIGVGVYLLVRYFWG